MSTHFFDMLEGLHQWCVAGQGEALPTQLMQAQSWLSEQLPSTPETASEWMEQWRAPASEWWPTALPEDWEPHWRMLSRREPTLTADALAYLDKHRPGAAAAMLPPPVAPPPAPFVLPVEAPPAPSSPPRWNLQDLVMCVTREVSRRERLYPQLMHQQKLSSKDADLELSQMRAVQAYLLARLQAGEQPQQQVLF